MVLRFKFHFNLNELRFLVLFYKKCFVNGVLEMKLSYEEQMQK